MSELRFASIIIGASAVFAYQVRVKIVAPPTLIVNFFKLVLWVNVHKGSNCRILLGPNIDAGILNQSSTSSTLVIAQDLIIAELASTSADYTSYRPAKVQVFCNDQMVYQDIACLPRPDVKNAGLHISGYCGFNIQLKNLKLNDSNSKLTVFIENNKILGQVSLKTKPEPASLM